MEYCLTGGAKIIDSSSVVRGGGVQSHLEMRIYVTFPLQLCGSYVEKSVLCVRPLYNFSTTALEYESFS